MKNIPKKIYLQIMGADPSTVGVDDFNDLLISQITWCSERINKSDIEYDLSDVSLHSLVNKIENAMERWHLSRDNDDETLAEINKILVSYERLGWHNYKTKC